MQAIIIDDSRAMRAILRNFLTELGYAVIEAPNGLEALRVLKANGPTDLALVDWNMPEMNGFEFVQAVRAERVFDRMRMIMCTTETEMSQVQRALAAGADEYIMKPFTVDVIRDKLAMLGIAA